VQAVPTTSFAGDNEQDVPTTSFAGENEQDVPTTSFAGDNEQDVPTTSFAGDNEQDVPDTVNRVCVLTTKNLRMFLASCTFVLLIHHYVLFIFAQARYCTNVQDIHIQAGKRALKLKGVQFCKTQISLGLRYFKMALANDPTLIEELQDYDDYESSEEDDEMEEEEDAVEGLANSSSEHADNDSVETE